MALDWIKWSVGLTKKREVAVLASRLKMSRREMAGTLMELWEWADNETMDGNVPGVDGAFIDDVIGVPGLAAAMASPDVGWLLIDNHGVIFPKFLKHNGQSAKKRALAADRKRQQRREEKDRQTVGTVD